MVDWQSQLNAAQYEAVTTVEGPVLVIAGAGSGKTRVIEYRVLYLLQKRVSPHSILLLTFTRKAAREMLSRAASHDFRCAQVEGGTFHSFAYRVLKRYGRHLSLPDSFTLLDEGDAEEAIQRCAVKMGLYDKEKRFPRKDTLRTIISMSVNKGLPVGEVLKRDYPHFLEYRPEVEELKRRYAEYKKSKGYLDYDDLLVYLRQLLENQEIRERLGQRYQFIMVDEYQDTNRLQGEITYLLGQAHRNVMAVGDDAQSIYGFRGATHENIMEFPRLFPGCRLIKLEENYRSTQSILDVANSVLDNMKNRYSKCLISAKRGRGSRPQILFFKDIYEEADWVAEKVKQLRDEGIALGHQGVLFRSSYVSIPLQAELSRRNIPFQLFGGLKFYETAHVKDLVAHLKILLNPRDELSWNRVLMLIEGIGPRTSERIVEEISTVGPSLQLIMDEILPRYIKRYKNCQGLARLVKVLRLTGKGGLTPGEQYAALLDYYYPIFQDKFDDWHLRSNDLEALRQIVMRYHSLEDFLLDFALEPPERGVGRLDPSIPEEEVPLTLATIHSAKGLEWEVVFLIGLVEGILPVGYALHDQEGLEEEHRLFYVAITRAKTQLYLSLHHEGFKGGLSQFNRPSRFVEEPNVFSRLDVQAMDGAHR